MLSALGHTLQINTIQNRYLSHHIYFIDKHNPKQILVSPHLLYVSHTISLPLRMLIGLSLPAHPSRLQRNPPQSLPLNIFTGYLCTASFSLSTSYHITRLYPATTIIIEQLCNSKILLRLEKAHYPEHYTHNPCQFLMFKDLM